MRPVLAAVALLVPFGFYVSRRTVPQAPRGFSVVVTNTPNAWSVECERGCGWKGGFVCEAPCDALVDSQGVVTLGELRPRDPNFQFIIRRTVDGVKAQPRSGTAWTALSWGCGGLSCRARVTELGVTVLR